MVTEMLKCNSTLTSLNLFSDEIEEKEMIIMDKLIMNDKITT